MLLVFCFTALFVSTFYVHKYFRRRQERFNLRNKKKFAQNRKKKFIDFTEMSDEEFAEPTKANNRWHQTNVNKVLNTNAGGMFRWKRGSASNNDTSIQNNEKRQKVNDIDLKENSEIESIDISDDEDEAVNVSNDSVDGETPIKPKIVSPRKIDLIEIENESPQKRDLSDIVLESPRKLDLSEITLETPKKFNRSEIYLESPRSSPRKCSSNYNHVPLPSGMPPVIAGVPVKFPVTPYKSQISVMNAVIKGCKNKEHCLLESPTGSGKTLALLCAALAWQHHFQESRFRDAAERVFKNHETEGSCGSCQAGTSNGKQSNTDFLDDPMQEKRMKVPKIYYGSRTHKQIEQVIREFKKTTYRDKNMTILSSREHTCLQKAIKGMSKTQICNDLRDPVKKRGCEYYNESNKLRMSTHGALRCLGFESPWDIEDLVDLGRRHRACPYFAARGLAEGADIIFCPYNYLIDPVIRDTMKIDLNGDIVIVDEAHNIESICRDTGSADFREDYLGEAIDDLHTVAGFTSDIPAKSATYECLEKYLIALRSVIADQILPEPTNKNEEVTSACWNGEETWTLLKMRKLGDDAYKHFRAASKQASLEYDLVKEDIQNGMMDTEVEVDENGKVKKKPKPPPAVTFITKKLLETLVMALDCIQNPTYAMDYRCTITMAFHYDAKIQVDNNVWTPGHGGKRLRTLKFMCMNPAVVFREVAAKTRCVILASGTLSPTSTFESELGTKFVHKLHANHVVPKEQVYVRGIPFGPKRTLLKATYRNVQTLPFKDDLGALILQVCQTVPHGVLCFFSSYSMMTSQIDRWQETGVYEQLQQCKHIVQEPRFNTDLDEIMRDYRDVIRDTSEGPARSGITGALLFAVFRGKVAEGIDFSDNEARCVLTIGIPYAVQNDPVVRLKREYNDLNRSRGLLPGGEWYSVQAYRALNQALGRCIRHRNDWGAVLLVDERLLSQSCAGYLPKWIREMRLEGTDYNLKVELEEFVKRQKIRDKERAASSGGI